MSSGSSSVRKYIDEVNAESSFVSKYIDEVNLGSSSIRKYIDLWDSLEPFWEPSGTFWDPSGSSQGLSWAPWAPEASEGKSWLNLGVFVWGLPNGVIEWWDMISHGGI